MQYKVSSLHMSHGKSLEKYVIKKMDKNISKFFQEATSADIIFRKDKHLFLTTIVIHEGVHKNFISVDAEADDAYSSFNAAMHKSIAKLRKDKDILKDHKKDHSTIRNTNIFEG